MSEKDLDLNVLTRVQASADFQSRLFQDAMGFDHEAVVVDKTSRRNSFWAALALASSLALGVVLGVYQSDWFNLAVTGAGLAENVADLDVNFYDDTLLALNY